MKIGQTVKISTRNYKYVGEPIQHLVDSFSSLAFGKSIPASARLKVVKIKKDRSFDGHTAVKVQYGKAVSRWMSRYWFAEPRRKELPGIRRIRKKRGAKK